MKKRKCLGMFLMAVLAASLVVTGCAGPTPAPPATKPTPAPPVTAPKTELPTKMMWTALDVGTSGYADAVGLGHALDKTTGMTVRVLPIGAGLGRMTALKVGTADIAFVSFEGYCAIRGIEEFTALEWGPQDIQSLLSPVFESGVGTTADSGIKNIADIKGKRVAIMVNYASVQLKLEAILAFAGLTVNDVKVVETPTVSAMYNTLIEGKADWVPSAPPTASNFLQLAASPKGVYYIPLPFADKEAWKRAQAVCPIIPSVITEGAGGIGTESYGFQYPHLVTYKGRISDGAGYELVKALDAAYEKDIKGAFPGSQTFNFKDAIKPPYEVPLHPGTIRYAKEKGFWDAEHEAANQATILLAAKTQAAWVLVINEAAEKGIKSADFPKYWLERKAQLVGK